MRPMVFYASKDVNVENLNAINSKIKEFIKLRAISGGL